MRYFFSMIATLAWALWFGGVMALFLFVTRLNIIFASPRRDLFSEVASDAFHTFERYQLLIGAVALVATFAWRMSDAGVSRTVLFCFMALAAGASITSSRIVTPKIEAIRQDWIHLREIGQQPDVESQLQFKRMHGLSMMVYVAQASLLLVAGAILPLAARTRPRANGGSGFAVVTQSAA